MGDVLDAQSVVPAVLGDSEVNDHVERTRGHHQQQANASQGRDGARVANQPFAAVYRQHVLVIHRGRRCVKSIGNEIP